MEEFGCTADAIEHYVTKNVALGTYVDYVSGWLLDLIADPSGNQIQLTYKADTETDPTSGYSYTRDVVLSTIEWDSPTCDSPQYRCPGGNTGTWKPLAQVAFQSQHMVYRPSPVVNPTSYTTCDTGTNLRCDDPLDHSGSGGLPAPAVQSTFVLNDILVQTRSSGSGNWNTLRDYQLGYEQGGPHDITDPVTGKAESVAGALLLSQFQETAGTGGGLTEPPRTFTYAPVHEYYEDATWAPQQSTTDCGPSWNTGYPGAGWCALWSEDDTGNEFFLATANNGMGLEQTFSWNDARNNTHGVNGGGSNTTDPLYCTGKESAGYPCNLADDQDWSHVVLTEEDESTTRVTQSGQGATLTDSVCGASGTITCTPITSTTDYTYRLASFGVTECTDCKQGMYWGNENEGDYLDYYNGKFMGFAQATVSLPSGAIAQHYYDATEGWGVYDTGQSAINCLTSNLQPITRTCHNSPWWDVTNAGHGHETEVDTYDTDGKHVLSATATALAAVCPPSGVSGTPGTSQSLATFGTFDGQLVSELDGDNPVAVCDVQTTRADTYTFDGSCVASVVGGTGTALSYCSTSGVPHRIDTYGYGTYGGVESDDRQSNGGSPYEVVDHTGYVWNSQGITAGPTSATGSYLVNLVAATSVSDGADVTRSGCTERQYDTAGYDSGENDSAITAGLVTSSSRFITSCGTSGNGWAPSGPLTTTTTYDGYGTPITSDDADASAGNTAHLGCLPGFGTTTYSTCDGVDQTYGALPIWHKDALNQISYTGYDTSGTLGLAGGYGRWPISTEDFNGQTTTFGYDTLGRMTSQTLAGETAGETTESWSYTTWCASLSGANSPCVEVDDTKRYGSASGSTVTTRAFYDGYGRLAETRSPGPSGQDVVAYATYDAAGHFTFESNSYFVGAYSGAAGPAAYSVPDTTQVGTSSAYDGAERVTGVTDAAGHTTKTAYAPAAGLNGDTGYYEQTTITDPLGHQRATLADAQGRETFDARYTGTGPYTLYATTKYYYDVLGDLTEILPPNGVGPVTDTYDVAGRKTAMSDPDRGSETYAYDADGNLTATTDARGAAGTVYAGYDGLDRLAWRGVHANGTSPTVSYTYDSTAGGNEGAGRLTGESFTGGPGSPLSGSYAYTYDSRGRSTQVTTTVGTSQYIATKAYDDASEVTSQTYPDGETVTTAYQGPQWFGGVSTSLGGGTTLAGTVGYSASDAGGPAGLITSMQLGGGTYSYADHYDLLKRRVSTLLTRTSDGATAYYQSRTFDANNNLTAETTDLQGLSDNQAFCYDEQSRLTWASAAGGSIPCGGTNSAGTNTSAQYTQSFSYDVLGRLTVGPLGSYTYGSGAHVHAATAVGGTWTGAYDAAGNLTCRAPSSATTCSGTPTGQALSYDAEGRLAAWQNTPSNPTSTASYLYDGEGNRVEAVTTSGGTSTSTVYLGNTEEVATTGSSTTTTTYYYAGSLRIALAVNGVISYLATDLLGSSSVALNASGSTTAAQLYAPYGGVRYASGTMPTDYGFTGQHSDAASTGLDYYVSRYYDPVVGQFISPDSTLSQNGYNPWGLSRYAYVQGNPETLADPDGHCWPVCTMIIGALIGAAVGAGISIVTQVASGHSINWGEVGTQAAVGAVSGAIAGLAGPEAGPLGGLAAHALIGAASGMAGQLVNNAMEHKPLGDGVLMAGLIGGVTGGVARGLSGLLGKEAGVAAKAVCGLSFAADTPVATPTGERPIASLKVGDQVVAYEPKTAKASSQTVERVYVNHDTDRVDVTLRVDGAGHGTKGKPTPGRAHRKPSLAAHVLVALAAFVAALAAPVPMLAAPAHALTQVAAAPASRTEVVHTTAKHPWLTADRGWVRVGALRLGEPVVRADRTTATVVALHDLPGVGAMYDLEVGEVHTFAVGDGQYVVHNCTGEAAAADKIASSLVRQLYQKVGKAAGYDSLASFKGAVTVSVGLGEENGERAFVASLNKGAANVADDLAGIVTKQGWKGALGRYVGPAADEFEPGGAHAESYVLQWAKGQGRELLGIGSSNFMCEECYGAVRASAGGEITRGTPAHFLGGLMLPF